MASDGLLCEVQINNLDILSESCRICMTRSDNKTGIFDAGKRNIVEDVQFCTGVQLKQEAGLPSTICTTCINNLKIAHRFKTLCIHTNETLNKFRLTSIKKEDSSSHVEYVNGQVKAEYVEENVKSEYEGNNKVLKYETKVKIEFIDEDTTPTQENEIEKTDTPLIDPLVTQDKDSNRTKLKETVPSVKKPGRPKNSQPRKPALAERKRLWCMTCNIKFDTRQQSRDHKQQKHKNSWICEICGKKFQHQSSLCAHVKSHLPPQYTCEQCDYKTWNKSDLVKHVRLHTGSKPYQCEFCSRSWVSASSLRVHVVRVHLDLRPHPCTLCEKTFRNKTELGRHMDAHNAVKRYECEVCHSLFSKRNSWKKHLLRRHGVATPRLRPGRQASNQILEQPTTPANNTPAGSACRAVITRHIFDAGNRNIIEKVKFCTGVQLNQEVGLPSTICSTCLNNLSIAHRFKTLCVLTNETLNKFILTGIKKEPDSDVEIVENTNVKSECEGNEDMNSGYEGNENVNSDYDENVKSENENKKSTYDTKVKKKLIDKNKKKVAVTKKNGIRKSGRIKIKILTQDRDSNITQLTETVPPIKRKRGRPKSTQPRPPRKPQVGKNFRNYRLWCKTCDVNFDTRQQHYDHKLQNHRDELWICEVKRCTQYTQPLQMCGKVFVHQSTHASHVKSHMPPQFACEQCDYKTWNRHDLVKHSRVQTGSKPYLCKYCGKAWATASSLKCHTDSVHLKLRRHACEFCGKTFSYQGHMKRHTDSHHAAKRYECLECRSCFTRRCYWKKHLLEHHGVSVPPQRPGRLPAWDRDPPPTMTPHYTVHPT